MSIRYTARAMTGLNDVAKLLKCTDERQRFWDAFADAKAEAAARAEIVREYLESSDCDYRMRLESGDHRYAVSFEYGPRSTAPALPFKVVFDVYGCAVGSAEARR
jgi:hypothetical protein